MSNRFSCHGMSMHWLTDSPRIAGFGSGPFPNSGGMRPFARSSAREVPSSRVTDCTSSAGAAGDVISNVWQGEWEDAGTGQRMKGFGVEIWLMQDGKIAAWEAAFNSAPADQTMDLGKMLG